MTHGVAIALHIGVGGLALAAYWMTLLTRKGSPRHRLIGKLCLVGLVAVTLTVGPALFTRPGPFDPGYVVQMIYLVICVATVSMLAFTAIRFKRDADRFRGTHFLILGPVLLILGVVVLAAGLAKGDPVAVTLSWVGLVFGSAMIGFRRYRGRLHERWWLGWHLNAVCALFNAVNGTFLFVMARWIGLVSDTPLAQTAFQVATIAAALGMRLWFGARYAAPMAFGARAGAAGAVRGLAVGTGGERVG